MALNLKLCVITLLLSSLFATFNAAAQEIDKITVDGFTGDTTTTTQIWNAGSNPNEYLGIGFSSSAHKPRIRLETDLRAEGRTRYTINQGGNVYLKMSDNNIITLNVIQDTQAVRASVRHGYYSNNYWTAIIDCALTDDDMDKLRTLTIKAVRIHTDQGDVDFGIDPKAVMPILKLRSLLWY